MLSREPHSGPCVYRIEESLRKIRVYLTRQVKGRTSSVHHVRVGKHPTVLVRQLRLVFHWIHDDGAQETKVCLIDGFLYPRRSINIDDSRSHEFECP